MLCLPIPLLAKARLPKARYFMALRTTISVHSNRLFRKYALIGVFSLGGFVVSKIFYQNAQLTLTPTDPLRDPKQNYKLPRPYRLPDVSQLVRRRNRHRHDRCQRAAHVAARRLDVQAEILLANYDYE